MKKMKKMFVFGAILIASFSMCTQSISARTITRRISGNVYNGKYIKVTTKSVAAGRKVYSSSRAKHVKGVETSYSISNEKTRTFESSSTIEATVGAEYLGVSASCSTSLGVSESVTSGITTSVSYTVPAKKPTCVYQIVAVFPAAKTAFEIYKMRDKEKFKVIKKKSITKMPYIDKAYYALEKG